MGRATSPAGRARGLSCAPPARCGHEHHGHEDEGSRPRERPPRADHPLPHDARQIADLQKLLEQRGQPGQTIGAPDEHGRETDEPHGNPLHSGRGTLRPATRGPIARRTDPERGGLNDRDGGSNKRRAQERTPGAARAVNGTPSGRTGPYRTCCRLCTAAPRLRTVANETGG